MAKLSVHGHEIARFKMIGQRIAEDSLPASQATYFYSIRSDGHVLKRLSVKWDDRQEAHSYGWKLWKKCKDRNPQIALDLFTKSDKFVRIDNNETD